MGPKVEYGYTVVDTYKIKYGIYVDVVYGDVQELMKKFPETYMICLPEHGDPVVTDHLEPKTLQLHKINGDDIVSWN